MGNQFGRSYARAHSTVWRMCVCILIGQLLATAAAEIIFIQMIFRLLFHSRLRRSTAPCCPFTKLNNVLRWIFSFWFNRIEIQLFFFFSFLFRFLSSEIEMCATRHAKQRRCVPGGRQRAANNCNTIYVLLFVVIMFNLKHLISIFVSFPARTWLVGLGLWLLLPGLVWISQYFLLEIFRTKCAVSVSELQTFRFDRRARGNY